MMIMASFALAFVVPALADTSAMTLSITFSIVFAAILVTLLLQAANRRKQLFDATRTELNKLRRMYHISKNLSVAAPERYRSWFTDVHGYLQAYLMHFSGKDFSAYDSSNAAFRKLSYHIYTIPSVETRKEAALFEDLLRTTATVAESRQQIQELWAHRMSSYLWMILASLAAGYVFTALLVVDDTLISRLAGGVVVLAGVLALDLLWQIDAMSSDRDIMAKRYVDNLGKLELGHRV